MREAAIWALGQSRLPASFEALKAKWERTLDRATRKILLAAFAALRLPAAFDFLFAQLRDAPLPVASDALAALAPYTVSDAVAQAVRAAVGERGEPKLLELFRSEFKTG
jgi:HEAT repeat protein